MRLRTEAELQDVEGDAETILLEVLANKVHPAREALLMQFSMWDADAAPPWTDAEPNSQERRIAIYDRLKLGALSQQFERYLPPKLDVRHATVISGRDDGGWYNEGFVVNREFYWPAFRAYLSRKSWDDSSLQLLHQSSSRVLEHLAPPQSPIATPRRGVVVGYVQSGKTTHFTAVIAKAIDAGFKLIVVLAGTIDLLREQTQRRLDMELVGKENILKDQTGEEEEREYRDDAAWDQFISFGARPRELGFPDIKRLTNSKGDFRSVGASFSALQYDEVDPKIGRAWHPDNIGRSNARLIVVKKNVGRLKQLIDQIKKAKNIREDLPTLIVDDESDQASVNTSAEIAVDGKRTKINAAIVKLLALLPRAHYVGYTATPFANVFVDPDDAADIFPKDFIISLSRPIGYMGVADFHDLVPPAPGEMGQRDAHVRLFKAAASRATLASAVDAFLVSGAIKLFRQRAGAQIDVTHHTMLVHETVSNADQSVRKKEIAELWNAAGYGSPGAGMKRLEYGLQSEFKKVSEAKGGGLPFPESFEQLKPFLAEARARIERDAGPVLMVNGTHDADDPQFDSKSVWKILVGGAKLSRGYTVEGLTITYFSRKTKQQDSLLQMGRWFGFRRGYKDLVRLFIEQSERSSPEKDQFDLYTAFEAVCRDEEAFRLQLQQYSHSLKPAQVPALVFNSYPRMMPTAKNKMFNAELVSAGFEGWKETGRRDIRPQSIESNWMLLKQLVERHAAAASVRGVGPEFECSRQSLVAFLDAFKWHKEQTWFAERRFLRESSRAASKWLVVFPLLKERTMQLSSLSLSVFERQVDDDGDFGAFSDKAHRGPVQERASADRLGVLMIYPTQPKNRSPFKSPVVGFAAFHPAIEGEVPVVFTVRVKRQADSVVVPLKGKA